MLLTRTAIHVSEHFCDGEGLTIMTTRGSLRDIWARWRTLHPRACIYVQESGLHRVINLDLERVGPGFVMALAERWWDMTHTFYFLIEEVGMTPLGFAALTGLWMGGIPIDLTLVTEANFRDSGGARA
ncbi:uncharacterized protein LOC143857349 [Tasmannia lanceolata]|uniref:uncharacterized protein LOC143857349 n=1 Tax=Tasmannia lanceolata TaxID=3420 RepID=UPI0040639808